MDVFSQGLRGSLNVCNSYLGNLVDDVIASLVPPRLRGVLRLCLVPKG